MDGEALFAIIGIVAMVIFIVAVAVLALRYAGTHKLGSTRYQSLHELIDDVVALTALERVRETEDMSWYPALDKLAFTGVLASGRKASIRFFTESVGSSTVNCVRLAVAADETPHLVVTEENFFTKVGKVLGLTQEIEIGDEAFDSRFLLKTTAPRKASRMLSYEVRKPIWAIFDWGARDLKVENGEIVVTNVAGGIEPGNYPLILESLDRIARTLDRKKIPVRVLGGERSALVDDSGRTRCPYCRANLTGDEENLVACEKCKTVLHDACWSEHGGCPLLGCTGRSPERARTR